MDEPYPIRGDEGHDRPLDRPDQRIADPECAREPIHAPGAIQPHGRLLVLSPHDGAVIAASANCVAAGGAAPTLAALLTPESAGRVQAAARAPAGADPGTVVLEDLEGTDGGQLTGLLHRSGQGRPVLVELEREVDPSTRASVARSVLGALNDAILRLRTAPDERAACAITAAAIRRMTGFDRVMVYHFLPDWSGRVIAEDLASDEIDSFEGLRFPASDIPAQARALYLSKGLRLIPDATAAAVPLRVTPGAEIGPLSGHGALDLSACGLRAVSPLHLQYLANMGVRASMSVAVVGRDGTLWGLVACHHQAGPLALPYETRQAVETVGRALGWRLSELEARELLEARTGLEALCELLVGRLSDPGTQIDEALAPEARALLEAVDAPGFALVGVPTPALLQRPAEPGTGEGGSGDGTIAIGPGAIAGLAEALDRVGGEMVVTDRLDPASLGRPGRALSAGGVCGLLAMRLVEKQRSSGIWVVWLRGELVHEVVWAGNPDKASIRPDQRPGRPAGGPSSLSPRHSFSAWREQARASAESFAKPRIAAAATIAAALQRGLLRRAGAVERENLDLARRNDEIRFFADAAVHDLREPLWQVQVFAGMLCEELGVSSMAGEIEDLTRMAAVIEESAQRMRRLLDGLSVFAGSGRQPDNLRATELGGLLAQVISQSEDRIRQADAAIELDLDDVETVWCDALQMHRVFQNLVNNALKYVDPSRPARIRIQARRSGRIVRLDVSDNGLGFAPEEAALIFEPFRRLERHSAVVADGLGLGLAICRRIVEAHGGTIEARGVAAEGAQFTVTLPDVQAVGAVA